MIRKSDEVSSRRPCVGLLMGDGSVERHLLNTDEDVYVESSTADKASSEDFKQLIRDVGSLGEGGLDFVACVKQYLQKNELSKGARTIIGKAIET